MTMAIIINIDELTQICGYFTGATDANNGYGCNHPEQEEFEMLWMDNEGYTHRGYDDDDSRPKTKQGKCYAFSCPLCGKCDLEDVKELDHEDYTLLFEDYNGDIQQMEDDVESRDNMVISEELYEQLLKKGEIK
jgi:hypothetical protein